MIDRTEIAPPGEAPTTESARPVDRTEVAPGARERDNPPRRFTRPRYRTPAERAPGGGSVEEPYGIEGPGLPDRGGDTGRHYEMDEVAPADPSTAPPVRHRGYRHGRHGRHGRHYGAHRHHHHYGCGHYGYGYYDPFDYYGYGYYSPYFYLGLGSYYSGPEVHVYGGGGGGSSAYQRDIGRGALDLDLRPESAEIYVDGVYVGVADQYDGFPTYLWLEEGTYEIAFYKDGYETIFRQYTIYPGVTIEVNDRMRKGDAVPPTGAYPSSSGPPAASPSSGSNPSAGTGGNPAFGGDDSRVVITATPGDAAVYLDGHFVGTAAEVSELGAGLIVEPGDHVIDVIRPGYDSQQVPVSVAAGERVELKLSL